MPIGLLVALIVLVALVVVAAGVGVALGSRRNIARERLMELKDLGAAGAGRIAAEDEELEGTFYERVIKPVIDKTAKRFEKKGEDPMTEMLMMAGNPGNLTPAQFKAIQLLAGLVSCSVMIFLTITTIFPLPLGIAFTGVAGGMSFIFPKFYLGSLITQRQKAIKKVLPDILDLLVVSVEAGLGFDQAIAKIVEKSKGPLADEFGRYLQEMKMGKTRREALKSLSKRTKVDDLDGLVAAIIQADTLGVSIGNILRIQSDQMRTKRRQYVEEQAQKLPIKMLFPMVGFIFPTIFIVILGPIGLKVWKELRDKGFL
jgi:tight adherence protein C